MAKYSRRRKSSRRRRSKPVRKRRSLIGGNDDELKKHLQSLYASMKSDEELHKTFIKVCEQLGVGAIGTKVGASQEHPYSSILRKEEKDVKDANVLNKKGIDTLLDKCYNNRVLIEKLGTLAEKNETVMEHINAIKKHSGGGQRGGRDVPRGVRTRADLLFASGVAFVIGGMMACVGNHFFVSFGTAAMIVGGGAIIVSCTLPGLYSVTRSLFIAVRGITRGNDTGGNDTEEPLNPNPNPN